jgi:hypothetical protein
MAESLYPDQLMSASGAAYVGAGSIIAALDASTSSYVQFLGTGAAVVRFPDTATVGAGQLGAVTLQLDARPLSTSAPTDHVMIGYLYDSATGAIYSKTTFHFTAGSSTFTAVSVDYGAVLSAAAINRLEASIFMPIGARVEIWEANDLRIVIGDVFNGPTTTPIAPTGAIADNTPSFVWSTAVDDANKELDYYGRIRVFNDDQYSAGGFDPATSPATWDSGWRYGPPLHEVVSVPLPLDTYRAYISSLQLIYPGAPWGGRSDMPIINGGVLHAGPYAAPLSFTIVNTAPAIVGPRIKLDAVRDLDAGQRALLVEPAVRPLPRVTLFTSDGIEVADLDVLSGGYTLDGGAQIRGALTISCSDIGLVPASRSEASGVNRPLHPWGSYLHVCYGIETGRSSQVMVGIGVFRVTSVKRDRAKGTVAVKAKDFALNLTESRFAYPTTRQTWPGPVPFTVLATAQAIISEAGLAYRTPASSATQVAVNYTNAKNDERPKALDGLAAALGWVWYFDIDGVGYFGPGPDLVADAIVYTFNDVDERAGRFMAQIVERDQELTRDDTFDVVIASDQAGLYIGGAYDAAPDSIIARSAAAPAALYVGAGSFSPGGKPFFYTSPTITSLPTAQAAARTRLAGVALPAEQITARCGPIPDLRPDKMIAMARDGETDLVKWQVTRVNGPLAVGGDMTFDAVTNGDPVVPAS